MITNFILFHLIIIVVINIAILHIHFFWLSSLVSIMFSYSLLSVDHINRLNANPSDVRQKNVKKRLTFTININLTDNFENVTTS